MKMVRIALLCFLACAAYAQCPSAYTAQRTVTVNSGQVSGTLTDYPRLVLNPTTGQADPNNLKTTGNGGRVTSANGYDIIFVNASGTLLDFELVGHGTASTTYDAATGNAEFRVKVASEAVGSVVYLCYGNAAVTTYQGNDSGTWGSAVGVWHFGTSSSLALTDSSASANTLTNASSAAVAGQIAGGVSTTSTHYLTGSDTALGFGSGAFSVGGWFKTSSATNSILLNFGTPGGVQQAYLGIYDLGNGHKAAIVGSGVTNIGGTTDLNDGAWHQITATNDGAGTTRLYVDGALINSGLVTWSIVSSGASGLAIGRDNVGATQTFTGDSDEITAIGTQRTASWVAAAYNNESAPGTYYAVGAETSPLSTMTVSPTRILNSTAGIVLTLSGINTSWSGGSTVFTVSGVSGTSKTAQSVSSATSATVTVTTGSTTGTLTVTETVTGSNSGTTTVYSLFTTNVLATSNTQAILSYNQSGACTVEVSESSTLLPLVHDVDPDLFSGANVDSTRTDALVSGSSSQFKIVPIGKRLTGLALDSLNYSRSLQAYTPHYFQVVCNSGLAVSTGSFTTKNIPTGSTHNDTVQVDPNTPGGYLLPSMADVRNYKINDPQTGAQLTRVTTSADKFGGSYGLINGFGGISVPCADQLQTAPGGEQGYLCVFWQSGVQYGSLFYAVTRTASGDPSTEWRNLGSVPNGVPSPSINNSMQVYYYAASPVPGLYRMTYNGNFAENGSGAASFDTPELYMASSTGGAGQLLHDFNPSFNNATYDGGFVYAAANTYAGFFAPPTGGPSQDVTGWLGVYWGGDGRVYDPACSDGPTACPHVVASFDLVSRSCLNHNWEIVPLGGGVLSVNTKSFDGSCTLGGFASVVFWNFLTDPLAASVAPDTYWPYGGHDFLNGVLGRTTEIGNGHGVVLGQPMVNYENLPLITLLDSPSFAGASANGNGNITSKHPSWMQSAGAPAIELNWISDFTAYDGGDSPNPAATHISGDLYSYTTSQSLSRKELETTAVFGYLSLRDISGPGSSIGTGAGDNYKFCVAHVANECRSGSSAGNIFVNVPSPTNLYCVGGDGPWPFNGDICIAPTSAYSQGVTQTLVDANVTRNIAGNRVISRGLAPWKQIIAYPTAKPLPDASCVQFEVGLGIASYDSNIWCAKLPPYPPTDTVTRNGFVPVPVQVPSGVASTIAIKFGYLENGGITDYYCTTRTEACVAGAGVSPYAFATTDTISSTSCSSGCTVEIPALSGRMLYYQLVDGSTLAPVGTMGEQVVIVP